VLLRGGCEPGGRSSTAGAGREEPSPRRPHPPPLPQPLSLNTLPPGRRPLPRRPAPPPAASTSWAPPGAPAWWDRDPPPKKERRPEGEEGGGGDFWDPLGLLPPTHLAARSTLAGGGGSKGATRGGASGPGGSGGGGGLGDALATSLPLKLAALVGLVTLSRVGVFLRLPGVDADAFAASLASGGLMGYIDTLSGGSISRVGVFSLGIVPYINASIVLQLMATAFPELKKLQREEGPQGRVRFQFYQKLLALAFAVVQAFGQLSYVRPFVADWSPEWLTGSVLSLTAGALVLIWIADLISELKVGNGTSILITANIASSLPTSVGAALAQAGGEGGGGAAALATYGAAFIATTLGVVYVQEAERQIPINYASRYKARSASLAKSAYLPFKVNATGVMPVIFASTLLSLPAGAARYAPWLEGPAKAVGPAGPLYLPVSGFRGEGVCGVGGAGAWARALGGRGAGRQRASAATNQTKNQPHKNNPRRGH